MIFIPSSIDVILNNSLDITGKLCYAKFKSIKTNIVDEFLLKHNISIKMLFYIWKHNLNDIPKCPTCGNIIPDKSLGRKYCCKECSYSEIRQNLIDIGYRQKNGDEAYYNMLHRREQKQENSHLSTQEKIKKTCMERYGVEHPAQNKEIYKKIKNTCKERYGVDSYSKTMEWKNRVEDTCMKKYNAKSPLESEEIQNKIKATLIEKYGTYNIHEIKQIQDTIQQNLYIKHYKNFIEKISKKNLILMSSYDEYINPNVQELKYKCLNCNTEYIFPRVNYQKTYCPNCIYSHSSYKENEVIDFIKSITNSSILRNSRNILDTKELDIYIPEKKLAIEFNGTYWHSLRNERYHIDKTKECLNKNIRLIHIFEYEWDLKKDICKSIIASALGVYKQKIYARKCVVKEISIENYKQFLNKNHIQGEINSSICYGLFYKASLVSVIGFNKINDEFELQRYCSLLNTQVIGGLTKLIKHSKIKDFITYIDLTHFNGTGYTKCGFNIISETKPSCIYVNGKFVTETINDTKDKKYCLLYDCGKIKMKYL